MKINKRKLMLTGGYCPHLDFCGSGITLNMGIL